MSQKNNLYETYISKSRYARYIDSAKRRENWTETTDRYITFLENHLLTKHSYQIPPDIKEEITGAIKNFEVMPSMRAIMTAGKALSRDNTAGYNCAYLPVDDPKSFDEAMYILLCGTGVGFSVERQYTNKLPEIPEKIYDSESIIVVSDSKEGWSKALRQLIAILYSGEAPRWDVSKVRAAGARLKTFGGRASGPAPLIALFEFVTKTFKGAVGRKLNSLECHDIMCKIAEVVVVGGVRRCLPGDTLVQVGLDKWIPIKEIQVGDIIHINNEEISVTNTFDQGIQEVMKIELDDGSYLESTANHKWLVFNSESGMQEWVMTKDLSDIHGMLDIS